ncbi:DUF2526 family protein [Pantoea sp. S18]|uniref:DUF2526 family protein n=1 Tax=Pantoea sp. S18 TaxID=3019892 RepID=UPI002B201FF6|nr:DUF2526 family protein [Pantoea sp. S18]MEA5105609.1 DUF2526 family protein [Pantoea sp. S18]
MTHTDKVIEAVDNALACNIIREINILLCELSEDADLSREFRFEQQHRLRLAVFRHSTEKKELAEQRRKWLTQGGIIC